MVRIENAMFVICGVPRGSVLGLILFILYTDNICSLDSKALLSPMLFSRVIWNEVRIKAAKEFKKVVGLLNYQKLSINYNRTMFINFSMNNINENDY